MKKLSAMFIALAVGLGLSLTAGAGSYGNQVAERIKKVGSVCVEGNDCGSAAAPTEVASAGGVEANYNGSCATCHNAGVAGAPKMGDVAAWEARLAKGMDALYDSGINGLAPGMPAKGMCFTCSDQDIRDLVDYMVDSVQ